MNNSRYFARGRPPAEPISRDEWDINDFDVPLVNILNLLQ